MFWSSKPKKEISKNDIHRDLNNLIVRYIGAFPLHFNDTLTMFGDNLIGFERVSIPEEGSIHDVKLLRSIEIILENEEGERRESLFDYYNDGEGRKHLKSLYNQIFEDDKNVISVLLRPIESRPNCLAKTGIVDSFEEKFQYVTLNHVVTTKTTLDLTSYKNEVRGKILPNGIKVYAKDIIDLHY